MTNTITTGNAVSGNQVPTTPQAAVPTTVCQNCGSATRASGPEQQPTLCSACRDRLRTDLLEIAVLYGRCADVLSPQRSQHLERVSGRRYDNIALDDDVLEVRADIRRRLAVWASMVGDAKRRPGACERHVDLLVGVLVDGLDIIADHPDAGTVMASIGELVEQARRVLEPDTRERLELGVCAEPECGATVTAVLGMETIVSCAAGHRWAPNRWLRLHAGLSEHRIRRLS